MKIFSVLLAIAFCSCSLSEEEAQKVINLSALDIKMLPQEKVHSVLKVAIEKDLKVPTFKLQALFMQEGRKKWETLVFDIFQRAKCDMAFLPVALHNMDPSFDFKSIVDKLKEKKSPKVEKCLGVFDKFNVLFGIDKKFDTLEQAKQYVRTNSIETDDYAPFGGVFLTDKPVSQFIMEERMLEAIELKNPVAASYFMSICLYAVSIQLMTTSSSLKPKSMFNHLGLCQKYMLSLLIIAYPLFEDFGEYFKSGNFGDKIFKDDFVKAVKENNQKGLNALLNKNIISKSVIYQAAFEIIKDQKYSLKPLIELKLLSEESKCYFKKYCTQMGITKYQIELANNFKEDKVFEFCAEHELRDMNQALAIDTFSGQKFVDFKEKGLSATSTFFSTLLHDDSLLQAIQKAVRDRTLSNELLQRGLIAAIDKCTFVEVVTFEELFQMLEDDHKVKVLNQIIVKDRDGVIFEDVLSSVSPLVYFTALKQTVNERKSSIRIRADKSMRALLGLENDKKITPLDKFDFDDAMVITQMSISNYAAKDRVEAAMEKNELFAIFGFMYHLESDQEETAWKALKHLHERKLLVKENVPLLNLSYLNHIMSLRPYSSEESTWVKDIQSLLTDSAISK